MSSRGEEGLVQALLTLPLSIMEVKASISFLFKSLLVGIASDLKRRNRNDIVLWIGRGKVQ